MGKLAEGQAVEDEDQEMEDEHAPAKVTHKVAEPKAGDSVQGILVTQQNSSKIVAAEDLATYTPLRTGSVSSRLHVPYVGKVETLSLFLHEMYRGVDETQEPQNNDTESIVTFSLHGGQVKVIVGKTKGMATVEWDCSPVGDVSEFVQDFASFNYHHVCILPACLIHFKSVADSLVALIMHSQSSAASIRLSGRPCNHKRKKQREGEEDEDPRKAVEEHLRIMHQSLRDNFISVEATYEAKKATFEITIDANAGNADEADGEENQGLVCTATVAFENDLNDVAKITVESEDEKLAANVRNCLQNIAVASAPFAID
jgi:hypothetical protein